jgi:RNA polymerase sigma-70 factor (ECF subfamily)
METQPAIKCGKHIAEHTDISGSEFHDVNLAGADFNNVNMSKTRFHDINFSDVTFTAAQIGGALFKHIGPPPDKKGKQARQRPVTFEETMLCDSTFRKVDMSNVKIIDCNIEGMTIDGIRVTDMMGAYKELKARKE